MFIFEKELFAFLGSYNVKDAYYEHFFHYGRYYGESKFHYFLRTSSAQNQPV